MIPKMQCGEPIPIVKEEWPCVAFDITLHNGEREWTTRYHGGIGHFPRLPDKRFLLVRLSAEAESIHTLLARKPGAVVAKGHEKAQAEYAAACARYHRIVPQIRDILFSLCNDAGALFMQFEDWAHEYGYDTDSRKAENIWRACCETARALLALGMTQDEIDRLARDPSEDGEEGAA